MITPPSPPGRWNALRCERAQIRYSTAAATSSTAASTKENSPNAERLNERASFPRNTAEYHGRNSVSISAPAAPAACCSSRGRARIAEIVAVTWQPPSLRRARSVQRDVLDLDLRALAAGAVEPLDVPVEHRTHGQQQFAQGRRELARQLGRDGVAQPVEQRRQRRNVRHGGVVRLVEMLAHRAQRVLAALRQSAPPARRRRARRRRA